MKTILFIFCLFSVACVTSGLKTRSIASVDCTIDNYRFFVFQDNKHPTRCHLTGAVLLYENLQGADLREADLQGADLRSANLRHADLWKADLGAADLRLTNLQGANLRFTSLRSANLRNANLREASLWDTDLTDAKVTAQQAYYLKAQGLKGFVVTGEDR